MDSSQVEQVESQIEKVLKPGTKVYLLAAEIAQRFNGETPEATVTKEERLSLSKKYGVDKGLVSNALTALRSIGLYRDSHYQEKHGVYASTYPSQVDDKVSLETKPTEVPPVTPPKAMLETTIKPVPAEASTPQTEKPSLPTDPKPTPTEASNEELRNQIGKQNAMITDLQGQVKSFYDYIQRNQNNTIQVATTGEEPPQVFEYPKDLLVRKVMWFVPKVLTLHQLYVEDAQKKGDVRPPTFVEWVNYMILEAYRMRQMDLALIRPPQPVRSGLFGD